MHTAMEQSISICSPLGETSLWPGDAEVLGVARVKRGRLVSGSGVAVVGIHSLLTLLVGAEGVRSAREQLCKSAARMTG